MMRSYLWDIIFIVLAVMIAFLLAGRPGTFQTPATQPAQPDSAAAKSETKSNEKAMDIIKSDTAALEKRNIFDSSGSYQNGAPITVPDNPYALLGVVKEGNVMKAIFREYTGKVTEITAGQKMIDGFHVAAVGNPYVVLERGKEKKNFNVFSAGILPSGKYETAKHSLDRKLKLVAVLEGTEKRAVFRDAEGCLSILGIKQSLPDGSVIAHIDSRRVKVLDGKVEKELALSTEPLAMGSSLSLKTDKSAVKDFSADSSVPARRRPPGRYNREHQNIQGGDP
ncbi:MAG TPA: hypothetical protein VMU29_11825 [Smithella sp.]|nr:hypothetical protein [Smithella sp.]